MEYTLFQDFASKILRPASLTGHPSPARSGGTLEFGYGPLNLSVILPFSSRNSKKKKRFASSTELGLRLGIGLELGSGVEQCRDRNRIVYGLGLGLRLLSCRTVEPYFRTIERHPVQFIHDALHACNCA